MHACRLALQPGELVTRSLDGAADRLLVLAGEQGVTGDLANVEGKKILLLGNLDAPRVIHDRGHDSPGIRPGGVPPDRRRYPRVHPPGALFPNPPRGGSLPFAFRGAFPYTPFHIELFAEKYFSGSTMCPLASWMLRCSLTPPPSGLSPNRAISVPGLTRSPTFTRISRLPL